MRKKCIAWAWLLSSAAGSAPASARTPAAITPARSRHRVPRKDKPIAELHEAGAINSAVRAPIKAVRAKRCRNLAGTSAAPRSTAVAQGQEPPRRAPQAPIVGEVVRRKRRVCQMVEQVEMGAGTQGEGEGDALAIGHDRVVAAMDEQDLGVEGRKVGAREIEGGDLGLDALGKGRDEGGYARRVAIVEERHHGAALRAQAALEAAHVGVEIGELLPR